MESRIGMESYSQLAKQWHEYQSKKNNVEGIVREIDFDPKKDINPKMLMNLFYDYGSIVVDMI